MLMLATPGSHAAEAINLTFSRTGTTVESVTVTADLPGVSASLQSVSHDLKQVAGTILCAEANGSSSPTIVMKFLISDFPAGWSFNNVGLDIHALNSSGGNQEPNDGRNRHFNVSVTSGTTDLVSFTDLDPAAGITGVRKVWDAATASTITPANPMELTITVTKGTENQGCFFGLEGITLSTKESAVEPKPEANEFYTIKWKNNTESYMTEQADGNIAIGSYETFNKVFWEFIPTGNENCYYIRNTATGRYLGSCNMTPSSSSRVRMSATPVEYYVHASASTSGDNRGCYWLSSTDCAGFDNETSAARCLNKDGASDYVITWTTGLQNVGSYWTLTRTKNLYEPRPFSPQPAIGNPAISYIIKDMQGRAYTNNKGWQAFNPKSKDSKWYFVGTSNAAGGYQIVSTATNEPVNNGARYLIADAETAGFYSFIGTDGNKLELSGVESFIFTAERSLFTLNSQIYQIPCGSAGDTWISSVTIGNEFRYPMAAISGNSLTLPTVTANPGKYVILTRDAATVNPSTEVPVTIRLNKAPANGYKLVVCCDWDRDGVFETSSVIEPSAEINTSLSIPAEALTGQTRLRLRLTSNGLCDPDAEVNGEILDLRLNVAEPSATVSPIVKVNDPDRGTAGWQNGTATATAKGNALFICWNEGHRIVGIEPSLSVEASAVQRVLTAIFSANTADYDGIDETLLNKVNSNASVVYADGHITIKGADSKAILLYAANGRDVASTTGSSLSTAGIPSGIYIVKAITSEGVVSAKLKI